MPGLKVVVPSNAYDAKGLLIQAIRDDDPVMFCEHKVLYPRKGEVPDGAYTIPFGEANMVREGEHVTVVAFAAWWRSRRRRGRSWREKGSPANWLIHARPRRWTRRRFSKASKTPGVWSWWTRRTPRCGMAAEICGAGRREGFRRAESRDPRRVTAPHTPVPFARELERAYVPGPARIEAAIRTVMKD